MVAKYPLGLLLAVVSFGLSLLWGICLGNLLALFVDSEITTTGTDYALTSNPLIYLIETALVVLILIHVIFALSLKVRQIYAQINLLMPFHLLKAKAADLSSRTMPYTGLAILGFLIWHVATFKYGPGIFCHL